MKEKLYFSIFIFLCFCIKIFAQDFILDNQRNHFKIPFENAGNLVIIPLSINGSIPLNFVLDSGSPYTIITNLNAIRHFKLKKGSEVSIKGLGKDIRVLEAYLSKDNSITIGKAKSESTDIILLFEDGYDLSSRFGIPIYGIIGYDLLKDFTVKINYTKKQISFYKSDYFKSKFKLKKYTGISMEMRSKKPYIKLNSEINNKDTELNLLIDSGSSEALWLFEKNEKNISIPSPFIEDYLGYGLNGEIHGKKTRISKLHIGNHEIISPTTSFPDSASIASVLKTNRDGSLGSEILKRFTVIFDYNQQKLFVKKNAFFDHDFHYNLAGLELYQPYPDLPYLEVAYVRENSPAAIAGLKKGDAIRYVNEQKIGIFKVNRFNDDLKATKMDKIFLDGVKRETITLSQIIELFKIEEGKKIHIVYTRGESNVEKHAHFKLENPI